MSDDDDEWDTSDNSLEHFTPTSRIPYTKEELKNPDGGMAKAKRMVNTLVKMVVNHIVDTKRVRSLVLYEPRTGSVPGSNDHQISMVKREDRPEIEEILHYRSEVLKIQLDIDWTRRQMELMEEEPGVKPHQIQNVASSLNGLLARKLEHTTAIDSLLSKLSNEQLAYAKIMAKFASDAAKLVQGSRHHKDKMQLADKKANTPSMQDLREKLALEYNVPVDQVDKILKAKTIEAEPAPVEVPSAS